MSGFRVRLVIGVLGLSLLVFCAVYFWMPPEVIVWMTEDGVYHFPAEVPESYLNPPTPPLGGFFNVKTAEKACRAERYCTGANHAGRSLADL